MDLDLDAIAARLYPTSAPTTPAVPPVDAKATTETAASKAAAGTTTAQHTDTHYALALPQDAVLEASAIERTRAFAKTTGLSPEAAQQALEHANGEVAAYQEQVTNDWNTLTQEKWVNDAKNDPEIGGEKFDGAVAAAQWVLAECADEESRQFLIETGLGNNRHAIRLLARVAKRMGNNLVLTGAPGGARGSKSDADVLYGN